MWWNLIRLGEDLFELFASGDYADTEEFIRKGISEDKSGEVVEKPKISSKKSARSISKY